MAENNCPQRQTFVMGTPPTHGGPNPRYIRPVVRINGMVQDAPVGYVIKDCYLPMDKIAEATNQTLSQVGSTVTLSGGGGTINLAVADAQTLTLTDAVLSISNGNNVTLPVGAVGVEPAVVSNAAIPTDVVGADVYLLGKPTAWLKITVGGTDYNVPAYA